MIRIRSHRWAISVALSVVLTACSHQTPPPQPSPDLKPGEVVGIVLSALQTNDEPAADTGIATAFAFASPGNQDNTGPLPRFIRMVEAGYAPLLDHRNAEIGPPATDGDRLIFPVRVYPREGAVRLYLFIMAKRTDADCDGCWVTDGVVDQTEDVPPELSI